ncbi:MAG: hypothetical protein JSS10_08505 [Verrucomicrobia bacterium]|nr:hypothetical protein [Verrucomicrobiota bacterium]
MFTTPLESLLVSWANKTDGYCARSFWLTQSRMVGVIEETGFAIAQPFIEIALTVEHLGLAIIKSLWGAIKSENNISRAAKMHVRHAFHHLIGLTVVSPCYLFRHVFFSIILLNPSHYNRARSNNHRFFADLMNSWSVSQRLAANILSKPNYSEEEVKTLFKELKNKNPAKDTFYQDGCLIQQDYSDEGKVIYWMKDGQHQRTWRIKGEESALEVTELKPSENFYPAGY